MSALPIRPRVMQAERAEQWTAWNLGERESRAARLDDPASLDDATRQALASLCFHPGDTLAVQQSHPGTAKHTLWLFTLRKSTKRGFWREATDGGRKVFVAALEPKLVQQVSLAASFEPVRPFDAFRDDPVGVDLTLVSQ